MSTWVAGLGYDLAQVAGNDRGETVQYQPQGGAAFAITGAVHEDLTVREMAALGGLFSAGDRKWLLSANQFPAGVGSKQGDSLTDASGQLWTLPLDAVLDPLGNIWTVHAVRGR